MKKSILNFALMVFGTLALSSCNIYSPFIKSSEDSYREESFSRPENDEGYYKPEASSYLPFGMKDVYESEGIDAVPSTGNVKILVLPIEFSDYSFSSDFTSDLKMALEGKEDGTTDYWESLSSFYYKSSFGKLNLSFDIASIYRPNMSSYKAYEKYASSSDNGRTLIEAALSSYKSKNSTTSFDSDGNGYIDGVIAVYSCPDYQTGNFNFEKVNDTSFFWAYTYWADNSPNKTSPTLCSYFWLSQSFLTNDKGADAHTLIHEFGHMLGLDDYYPESNNGFYAAGGLDMMDFNILDHDSYSKSILGWCVPTVITGDCTIDIEASNRNGDCVIIPSSSWNGTGFGEYIMLELYTPDKLNELDSKVAYTGRPLGYTIPGVKIYHIDSRLMEAKSAGGNKVNVSYYNGRTLYPKSSNYYQIGATNCQKSVHYADEDYSLIHLMEANGINTFKNANYGTNATLFKKGSTFSLEKFGKNFFVEHKTNNDGLLPSTIYTLNNGDELPVEIKINSVFANKASISFSFK